MRHALDSLLAPVKTSRHSVIEFPERRYEPDDGDGLGAIGVVVWCFLFEVSVCIVVALAWKSF
jgi:hypothetical protein